MTNPIIDPKLREKYDDLVKTDCILPIKISEFYMSKVK